MEFTIRKKNTEARGDMPYNNVFKFAPFGRWDAPKAARPLTQRSPEKGDQVKHTTAHWLTVLLCSALAIAFNVLSHHALAGSKTTETMTDYNGPADIPRQWGTEFERLRQPYVEKARKTYPEAKERFQAGLPKGYRFFVTVDFQEHNVHENGFLQVRQIAKGMVTAIVATKFQKITSPRYAESIVIPETRILDWTITSPNGSEEGNYVGKFLDEYYKTHP